MIKEVPYVQSILDKLDEMMNSDDSDALFVSGYLRGHVTFNVGALEMEDKLSESDFFSAMNNALLTARQTGELTPQDSELVTACWRSLTI